MLEEKQIGWQNINTSVHRGKILTGIASAIETEKITIVENNENVEKFIDNLIIKYKQVKILIPASEIKEKNLDKKQLRNMLGAELRFVIIEVDKLTNKAVASRKRALQIIRNIQLKKYQKGDKTYARVISTTPKYIEVECLGIDLKLKAEDLEYGYIANLKNNYQVGDKIRVVIKEIDAEKQTLKVSHKETKQDPYKIARANYEKDGIYSGIVTGYSDNGIFVRLEQGIDTLATFPNYVDNPPSIGDCVSILVTRLQPEKRKIYSAFIEIIRRANYD